MDQASRGELLGAQAECLTCPLLEACTRKVQELIAKGSPPKSQVMAGVAYNSKGVALTTLRQRRSRRSAGDLVGAAPADAR